MFDNIVSRVVVTVCAAAILGALRHYGVIL